MIVELAEVADHEVPSPEVSSPEVSSPEVLGPRIDAAWLQRATMPGQSFSGTTAANDAAKVLDVSKLSASPYKRLQGLLDAMPHLNSRWLRRENNIVRR